MPIYEYRCLDCGKRNSLLVLSPGNPPPLTCRHCSGSRLERLMSRFAAPKSEDARLESLADPSRFGDVDESDPQSMARMMKKMGEEMGEDFGDDLDEALNEPDGGASESGGSDLD